MSIIGPLKSGHGIEIAVLELLKDELAPYVNEAAIQDGLKAGSLQWVKSWGLISEYDRWPESNLPAILLAAPGLRDEPERSGDGAYSADWTLGVSITVGAANARDARRFSQVYAAAIRGCVMQRLSGDLRASDWLDEAYWDVSKTDRKVVAAAECAFAVQQSEVVNWRGGPSGDMPDEIPESFPIVKEVDVKTEIER
jgi:hypothetical protein